MRIVIDTNLWISAFISNKFKVRLLNLISIPSIDIIGNHTLIQELKLTASRPKFQKYISSNNLNDLLNLIINRLEFINEESKIEMCRDSNDDFLLSICKDGNVDYLITGDKDLLVLNPFENTQILTLTEFEAILLNQ